jgi:hypothetical protein
MKFSGLFRKQNKEPEVTESDVKESVQKLWKAMHRDVFTADAAREIANNKENYRYLDTNVIRPILESVQNAACRHRHAISGSIGGMALTQEEIEYCITYLSRAGYGGVSIYNATDPNVFPESLKYYLEW